MKYIQCIMPFQRRVLVERPGRPRLEVDVFTPIAVPESEEEQTECGERFVPMGRARRLVNHGWAWVTDKGKESEPAPILDGPLPTGFPYSEALRAAGYGALQLLPLTITAIAKIPNLVAAEPGRRVTAEKRHRAAREILDAIDALIRKES